MQSKKFKVVTLGCRTNQYESEAYRTQLKKLGYVEASEGEEADLCVVNTCTVTKSADERSKLQIKNLNRDHPNAEILVTGCLAEKEEKALLSLNGVAHVVKNHQKENLLNIALPDEAIPEFQIEQFSAHSRAFVKVQDGCNSFCSYCVIPYVRGRSRSRQLKDILNEIEGLVKNGYKEVVLTGINIGDFDGGNGSSRLKDLVVAVNQVEGIERIRISSIDPDEVDDELLKAVIDSKKCCPSMHVVLQSGSNHILKKMRRKYTKQQFFDTVRRLKEANDDFTFTTDVIVGFPQESEEDHLETLKVIEEVEFVKVHMFPYSIRPGTKAARMEGHIDPLTIDRRKRMVLEAGERMAFSHRSRYVGRKMEVLIESNNEGHTRNFLPVRIEGEALTKNRLVMVKLIENRAEGLIGVLD